jgi:hypothetical protein
MSSLGMVRIGICVIEPEGPDLAGPLVQGSQVRVLVTGVPFPAGDTPPRMEEDFPQGLA